MASSIPTLLALPRLQAFPVLVALPVLLFPSAACRVDSGGAESGPARSGDSGAAGVTTSTSTASGGTTSGGAATAETDATRQDLADPDAWVVLEAADDPFTDRPADAACDPSGLTVEHGLYEVQTGPCPYLSAGQPTLADVRAGDAVSVLVYHTSLTSDDPAEAHLAVALDGALVWEETVAIPAASGVHTAQIPAAGDAPAGSVVVFHLHNHGSNAWTLGHLRVEPPDR